MFASKLYRPQELICVQGKVLENVFQDDKLNSYLHIKIQDNTCIRILYNREFPPPLNTRAGDVGFSLRMGDEVEIMAAWVNSNLLSTCDNRQCEIIKLGIT